MLPVSRPKLLHSSVLNQSGTGSLRQAQGRLFDSEAGPLRGPASPLSLSAQDDSALENPGSTDPLFSSHVPAASFILPTSL